MSEPLDQRQREIQQRLGELLKKEMSQRVSDEEVRSVFNGLFDAFPGLTAELFRDLGNAALKFNLFHEPVRLLKRWNVMAPPEKKLSPEVFLADSRADYRKQLSIMAAEVKKTAHLGEIFDGKWFSDVDAIIERYNGEEAFRTDTHTAFIGFVQDGSELLQRFDLAYGAILKSIGKNRISRLRMKLRDFARPLSDYLGTVFEVLVLGPCAKAGYLKEIEPPAGAGTKRADGLIEVDGTRLLIEATVTTEGRPLFAIGAFDPAEGADKVCRKIVDKAEQLTDATEPILLFLAPYITTFGFEAKMGIQQAFERPECRSIAGVVLADEYRANRLRVAWNSSQAAGTIPDTVKAHLEKMYGLKRLDMSDLSSDD